MRLKITTPEKYNGSLQSGRTASLYLDGVDVSRFTNRVVLTVDVDDAIHADVRFFLTSLDIDVPAEIKAALGGHRRVELSAGQEEKEA